MKFLTLLLVFFSCGIMLAQTAPAAPTPMGSVEVLARVVGTSNEVTKSYRVERLVRQRGLNFKPTDDYLQTVKSAGGEVSHSWKPCGLRGKPRAVHNRTPVLTKMQGPFPTLCAGSNFGTNTHSRMQ